MQITILHTNDLHGALNSAKAQFIRALRNQADLYFDSGDCIKAGNLAIPLKRDTAWELLRAAGCDAGTIGNRETHILESAFQAKLSGHQHPLVCANLKRRDGSRPLPPSIEIGVGSKRVGIIGVMVPMVTAKMATQGASAYLWDPPIPSAIDAASGLEGEVDLLIALTHIGITQDRKLAEACPQIDLILGGHSHSVLHPPERVGDTWICQGGSHGRYVGKYLWEFAKGLVESELIPIPGDG